MDEEIDKHTVYPPGYCYELNVPTNECRGACGDPWENHCCDSPYPQDPFVRCSKTIGHNGLCIGPNGPSWLNPLDRDLPGFLEQIEHREPGRCINCGHGKQEHKADKADHMCLPCMDNCRYIDSRGPSLVELLEEMDIELTQEEKRVDKKVWMATERPYIRDKLRIKCVIPKTGLAKEALWFFSNKEEGRGSWADGLTPGGANHLSADYLIAALDMMKRLNECVAITALQRKGVGGDTAITKVSNVHCDVFIAPVDHERSNCECLNDEIKGK